jgi:hypothetical protein
MGKFKTSRMIALQSWSLLKQDKEMVFFPILSAVTSLVFFALLSYIFYVNFYLTSVNGAEVDQIVYLFLIVYYIVAFFIVDFFQSGIFVLVHARFSGQNLSFLDGISISFRKILKILIWSLISATVGIILDIISDKFKIVGRIVAAILGAGWNIMTYFSLPALVIGDTTITGSFKESARLIRKVWGETFIVNVGAGLFFSGIILFAFLIGIIISIAIPALIFACIFLFIVLLVLIFIISSTLDSIFKLVIYEYARTGEVPSGFSLELINSAIKSTNIKEVGVN